MCTYRENTALSVAAHLALCHRLVRGRVVGALRPGQRVAEALDEVEQAPGDDGVVVQGHVEGDDPGGDADAAQVGGDLRLSNDRVGNFS